MSNECSHENNIRDVTPSARGYEELSRDNAVKARCDLM
jgi:hypothetical protein